MIILLILVHSSYCPSQFQGSMTNCLYRFAVLFFSLVLFFSCKKEDIKQTSIDPTDSTQTGLVTGKVVSYDSNTASTQNWKVNSGLTDTVVMNNRYSVEVVEGDFGFQMVSDSNDREVLLGVTYPGQLDFTINLETTITAMLMCFPDVHWLSTQGRINLIGKIKSSPLLPEVSGLLRADLRCSGYPIPNADTEDLSSSTVGLHCTGGWLADYKSASYVVRDALRNILDSEPSGLK